MLALSQGSLQDKHVEPVDDPTSTSAGAAVLAKPDHPQSLRRTINTTIMAERIGICQPDFAKWILSFDTHGTCCRRQSSFPGILGLDLRTVDLRGTWKSNGFSTPRCIV
jgi:hypothetical protein